jgi:transposase-like protein
MLPALAATFSGVPWQRCREGFIEQVLQTVPQRGRGAVEAGLRAAFAEPDAASALEAFDRLRGEFGFTCPELRAALEAPVGAPLTYYQAPRPHRHLVSSLNGLAPMQRELRQSAQLVGIFPHRQALLRLAGTILQEIADEWAARPQRLRRRARGGAVAWAGSAPEAGLAA